jgi:hypothetical protein
MAAKSRTRERASSDRDKPGGLVALPAHPPGFGKDIGLPCLDTNPAALGRQLVMVKAKALMKKAALCEPRLCPEGKTSLAKPAAGFPGASFESR